MDTLIHAIEACENLHSRGSDPENSFISESDVRDVLNLHDGNEGVVKLITKGPSVIPAVRSFLFRRNKAGIYQPRCWAVEVLAALCATAVLKDYLLAPRPEASAIERFGDEAVINAAARALCSIEHQSDVYELLFKVAQDKPFPGVLEALGTFKRKESVPLFIKALAEDDCRAIAESALRELRPAADSELWRALTRLPATARDETERRQRLSILRLLLCK